MIRSKCHHRNIDTCLIPLISWTGNIKVCYKQEYQFLKLKYHQRNLGLHSKLPEGLKLFLECIKLKISSSSECRYLTKVFYSLCSAYSDTQNKETKPDKGGLKNGLDKYIVYEFKINLPRAHLTVQVYFTF